MVVYLPPIRRASIRAMINVHVFLVGIVETRVGLIDSIVFLATSIYFFGTRILTGQKAPRDRLKYVSNLSIAGIPSTSRRDLISSPFSSPWTIHIVTKSELLPI